MDCRLFFALVFVVTGLGAHSVQSQQRQLLSAETGSCNLTGTWRIEHIYMKSRRIDAVAIMQITQTGTSLTGTGREDLNSGRLMNGRVVGRDVNFDIAWSNGFKGRYIGIVQDSGYITGTNFDINKPSERQVWNVRDAFRSCKVAR